MSDFIISYYDASGIQHRNYDGKYQCAFASEIILASGAVGVIYITKKDPFNCTSETFVMTGSYKFEEDYIYFVRIDDQEANEIVELTRLWQIGQSAHQYYYGICEDGCRVRLPRKYRKSVSLFNDVGYPYLMGGLFTIEPPDEITDLSKYTIICNVRLTHSSLQTPIYVSPLYMKLTNDIRVYFDTPLVTNESLTLTNTKDVIFDFTFIEHV